MESVKKISIVIPVFNEGKRVVETINNILINTKNDLVVVDDGSTDNTKLLLESNFFKSKRVIIVCHDINRGKGVAMITGANVAWKHGAEAIIFIDADGQHDPKLLKNFENYLNNGDEIVIGVRVNKLHMSFLRKFGNWVIRVVLAILYGQTIEDMLCGYRAMTKKAFNKILWTSERYGVETEMMCNIWQAGVLYRKTIVETIYTEKKRQKKDCFTTKDGLKILLLLPYWWWRGRN